ncbi:MAPEG family protein [Roseomonas sp. CAU 1739]|uniref:MAPEG family protein n=1 Tax=Roseomonas sp. CAU 1739 TaxID=3140364 RepID=UPI00325BA506
MPRITALYAGLLLVLFLVLTARVLARRFKAQVVLGTGGDRMLERVARVHANCAEYVPIFLATLLAAELCGAPAMALHAAGLAMLAGRVAHAAGMSRDPDIVPLRAGGMILTLTGLVFAAALALGGAAGLW